MVETVASGSHLTANVEMVAWQGGVVHACELFSHSQRVSYARNEINGQFLFRAVCYPLLFIHPDLAKGHGGRNGQEEEVVDRVFPLLCLCAGRRFRELVRIHLQIPDVVDLFWYAGEEMDGTRVRSLLIGFDAVCETAIPDDMEFGDVVKSPLSGGFGVVTIE